MKKKKAAPRTAARAKKTAAPRPAGPKVSRFLGGARIDPRRVTGSESVSQLIEGTFLAYNAARLREAAQLFTKKMLEPDVTVGLTLTGALTPAGLGIAVLIPLIEA